MRLTSSSVLIFGVYFLAVTTGDAWAYLDPMGGSMLVQIIVGGLVGGFVMLKLYWRRLLDMIGLGNKEDSATKAEEPGEE